MAPQLPGLLNGYIVRPSWTVAGVDYAVGVSSGTVLKNPTTISMAGVSVNIATHLITVTGDNVVLDGYDFSLNGGWGVRIASGADNLTIQNSYFQVGTNNLIPILASTGAGYINLLSNTIDGNGLGVVGNPGAVDRLFVAGQGATVDSNWFLNAPQDGMNFYQAGNYTVTHNLFSSAGYYAGAHSDWIQIFTGAISSLTIEYNTVYQPAANAQGWPGTGNSFVRIGDENGTTVSNPVMAYNTIVALGATGHNLNDNLSNGAFANIFQITANDGVSASKVLNPSIHDNFIDPTGVMYAIQLPLGNSGNLVNPTSYNEFNMTNGGRLLNGPYQNWSGGDIPANAPVITGELVAVAIEGSMYGAVGTSAEITFLATEFLPAQVANAVHNGFNPLVYASEALGLAFAFGNETGSMAFANTFGPSNATMPNSVAGDAAYAVAASNAIFGSTSTPNLANVLLGFVTNWKAFYTLSGIPGILNATAEQVDLAARGAAWGDAVGIALADDFGLLKAQTTNFLMDAAEGIASYSMSLVGQPAHHPFQGEI